MKLTAKFKKAIVISICLVILFVALTIIFISPITKYLVEKYDEKWTGRRITLDQAYVNPFTGYVQFNNIKFYELKSDSVFLSAAVLSGKFELLQLLHGNYFISQLTLDHPVGNIIQTKKEFNFISFIDFFTPEIPDTSSLPGNFNILRIKIIEGEFHYFQKEIPITYFIKGANIETDGKLWDADTVVFKFNFLSGPGSGSIAGTYTLNFNTLDYHYDVIVNHFDLTPVEQYLKAIANYGSFRTNLDANLSAVGNFKDPEDVTAHGHIALNDFHFGKTKSDDYASFDKLLIGIDELSPKNRKYIFDSVSLSHPVLKYEEYDYLDNIERMFGFKAEYLLAAAEDHEKFNLLIEVARYVKALVRNFFQSYYRINNLEVKKADLRFNNYALSEKFFIAADPLDINADSIDKNRDRVILNFRSGIQPFGKFTIDLGINPRDSGDFNMEYHFHNLPASLFNPYMISYTSFPLDRGTIELNGSWKVRKGDIQSKNHLVIIDPRVTKRVKNKNTSWLPLPLIMSFVREYGNVIDYEIPITGNLKNPKFHLRDVLFDILGNIFVKPVTTPYRMEVRDLEKKIEKLLTLKWAIRQSVLFPEQEKFLDRIASFLKKNPNEKITVSPRHYALKEKEYILFFEAKKKYFLSMNQNDAGSFSESDSEKVDKMSVKDSLFNRYLNKHISDSMVFTVQEKCSQLVGSDFVNHRFNQLNQARRNAFMFCFKEEGVQNQVNILNDENEIPYNGFSYYKIDYQGKFPESLTKAYEKIQELNDEKPRKKYTRDFKKNKQSQ